MQEKETITCPITNITMKCSTCPVESCMWNVGEGECFYKENISGIVLGNKKGFSVDKSKDLIRKKQLRIEKGLLLDKYIEFIKENNLVNKNHNNRKDLIRVCAKINTFAWNKVFGLDVATFTALCSQKNFNLFCKNNGLNASLTAVLGIKSAHKEMVQNRLKKRAARKRVKENKVINEVIKNGTRRNPDDAA